MKVVTVKDIERKDVPIYYRRLFSGMLVLEILHKTEERRINFTIETMPTGQRGVFVTIIDPIDYPLTPLIREVKKYLQDLDDAGGLPG